MQLSLLLCTRPGRTLQDYTRWVKTVLPEVTEQLQEEAKLDSLEEWQKYVAVLFDEIKIKEGMLIARVTADKSILEAPTKTDDFPVAKNVVCGVFTI